MVSVRSPGNCPVGRVRTTYRVVVSNEPDVDVVVGYKGFSLSKAP